MKLDKNILMAGGGMAMLLTGSKLSAIGTFAKGVLGLERGWRAKHPDVPYTLNSRWNAAIRFYEATHENDTNRLLHRVGIPMIVGGALGLLVWRPFRPLWTLSAMSFTAGWALNIVGHARYEKKAPAFADDPLSFIAGPVWDVQQYFRKREKTLASVETAAPSLN